MIYVTGYDSDNKVIYFESCETTNKAADRVDEYQRMGLENIDQWAVKPSYRNPYFLKKYPDTHKIVCWDNEEHMT